MTIDHDDPRPPYLQVAAQLRAAILGNEYQAGDRLPSQSQIAERFGVARMTAQQALRILREQGLIASRTGSGNFVRSRAEKPVGLRPHIEVAFRESDVSIDFLGYTAETLANSLVEPFDKVRSGQLPVQRIRLRLLVVDTSRELVVPSRGGTHPGDEPLLRERMERTTTRSVGAIRDTLDELTGLDLLELGDCDVRVQPVPPLQKIYIVNRSHVFWGYYPIKERTITVNGHRIHGLDPVGKDTVLFHRSTGTGLADEGTQFVESTIDWFESLWSTLGTPFDHD